MDRPGLPRPALVVFALFVFYPLVRSIVLSFQGTDIIGRPAGFVGGDNYAQMFSDPDFGQTILVTVAFVVATVVPSIAIALAIALALQGRIRGIRFFRTAFALPFAFSVATASVVFQVLYNPASGVLNGLLSYIGVGPVQWLTNPTWPCGRCARRRCGCSWATTCSSSAPGSARSTRRSSRRPRSTAPRVAAQPVDHPAAHHAAAVLPRRHRDGPGPAELRQIKILTVGGPERRTTTLVYSIYDQAFNNNNSNFGYASAQAVVLLLVVLAVTAVQFGILERKVFYR